MALILSWFREGTARMARLGIRRIIVPGVIVLVLAAIGFAVASRSGQVLDEAKAAGRDAASFPAANENYFREMDGGIALTDDEVKGRNMWILWTGGNDRLWDKFIEFSFGNFDLLKILSSYPGLKFSRDNRWDYFGLVNEPCFTKAAGPDDGKFGLWLDRREASCAPDPFENENKYPGVKVGSRGSTVPVGSYYGTASGIVGLRLFPNPDFDEAAKKTWDPVRYYTDPSYYNDKKLVRPYRVGMSCGFCHVGPNPLNPPADSERPKWENLSSLVGAQYFWVDRIFNWQADPKNFIFQLVHTTRPGALDTSLVSTDYINNPRTMNAIYDLPTRMELARDLGKHLLVDGNLDNKQFNDYAPNSPLAAHFRSGTAWVPHVQKDASDSVGALGALNRVYLNIGLFSEEWLLHFNPVLGGKPISPIRIKIAQQNSSYWRATEDQSPAMAAFLLKAGSPHRLTDAPGGARHLTADAGTVDRGKVVFAETCARCHSSKYPTIPPAVHPDSCTASNYLDCWGKYWAWTKTPDFKTKMTTIVQSPDFLNGNFLSNDMRVPTTLLQTNLCSPLATNSIAGNIWDEFSSASYKALPTVGELTVTDPVTGKPVKFAMPAGGRGYSRPASLVSLWSTAPFLLNNSVGRFEAEPSVDARMRSFDDSIRQLLWPEMREMDTKFGAAASGLIDRLPGPAYLTVPAGHLPGPLKPMLPALAWALPAVFSNGTERIEFTGSTTQGSAAIAKVRTASLIATFSAGAPVSGPGIPSGARVVVFDAATQTLTIDQPATATAQGVALATDAPDAGLKLGPIPAGTPISLFSGVELAPETGGVIPTTLHELGLAWKLIGLPGTLRQIGNETDPGKRESLTNDFQSKLYSENKCPDFVVNRGHYFGTDKFGEEPGLSDQDKEALIAFLKTF
jgi:hypothetical protein